jgi:hypothetical protein
VKAVMETAIRNAAYPTVLTSKVADSNSAQGPIIDPQKGNASSVKGNWAKYQVRCFSRLQNLHDTAVDLS